MIISIRRKIVKILRNNAFSLFLLDWLPVKALFFDNIIRIVPRRIKSEIKTWRKHGILESNSVFTNYSGGDFIDIGSFHGMYGLILAPKANNGDKFLFLEPDLKALNRLNLNIGILSNLFPKILFSTLSFPAGNGEFFSEIYHDNNFHPKFSSENIASINHSSIKSIKLDDLVTILALEPKFIKIDVEGAELSVLEGLTNTLMKFKPVLMLEIHYNWQKTNDSTNQILTLLGSLNYKAIETLENDEISIRQIWK